MISFESNGQLHAFEVKIYIPVIFKFFFWRGAEGYVSGVQDDGLLVLFCGLCVVGG